MAILLTLLWFCLPVSLIGCKLPLFITCIAGWWCSTVVECRSLAGELSLSGPRPAATRLTTYVGKPPAAGQPTRPTQPFILLRLINCVVGYFIGCVLVAPSGECSRGLDGAVDQPMCAICSSSSAVNNPSVYSAALHGSCCGPPCVADVITVLIVHYVCD